VVAAILVLVAAMALPAVRSIMVQTQRASAVQKLEGLLVETRAVARSRMTTAILRVERAFETDDNGQMLKDLQGNALWKDHQQARILITGYRRADYPRPGVEHVLQVVPGTGTTELPRWIWLAPGDAMWAGSKTVTQFVPTAKSASAIDTLDTFYVAFDRNGQLIRMPPDQLVYMDPTQGNVLVDHPSESVRSVMVYNRELFESPQQGIAAIHEGRPLYVGRYGGALVHGRP
jgi:hypothetical protein